MRLDAPVFLLGMPRSGTTWLSQTFDAHPDFAVRVSPNDSRPLQNQITAASTAAEWLAVLGAALDSDDEFLTQRWQRRTENLPEFVDGGRHSHLAIKDTRYHDVYLAGLDALPDSRAVYLIRHPVAALHSWATSPEFPVGADLREEWRTGWCRKQDGLGEYWGYDDWVAVSETYLAAQAARPAQVIVVAYEELVDRPAETIERVFSFLGVPSDPQVHRFLDASHARHDTDPYSVYKDPAIVRDRWRDAFPVDIQATIADELRGTRLEKVLQCAAA